MPVITMKVTWDGCEGTGRITYPNGTSCTKCWGSGVEQGFWGDKVCSGCDGEGKVRDKPKKCSICGGKGKLWGSCCPKCGENPCSCKGYKKDYSPW